MVRMTRQHLLTGIDLGPRSAAVLSGAREMARSLGADLSVVHLVRPHELADPGESAGALTTAIDGERRRRQREIEDLVAEHLHGGYIQRICVETGEPVAGLLFFIERLRPGLVVLGGQPQRILPLCGVAEKVSRLSPVPVVLIPSTWNPAAAGSYARPQSGRPRLQLVR